MLSYKKIRKEIKKRVTSTSTRDDIKEIVTMIYKQNIMRTIKYDKFIKEITNLHTNNTTVDASNEILETKYNKLRSQLETLIKLNIELHKTEKKSLLDIQIDIQKSNHEYIDIHNDYTVLLLLLPLLLILLLLLIIIRPLLLKILILI